MGRERKAARAKPSDEEYAAKARATAEREAAADPAQALRLRAIDRLIAQREKKPLSPLLAAFVEKAKASLGDLPTGAGPMIHHHCIAELHEDEDQLTLWFKLADDRTVVLTYSKNGDLPYVSVSHGGGDVDDFDSYFETPEEFEDWVKIALNAMSPDRERRWLCQICKERRGFGPMLPDDIWAAIKVVPDPGYSDLMCLECMKKRARQILGREL